MGIAIQFNISVYDACYIDEARSTGLPLATNDTALGAAAGSYGIVVMKP